MNDNENMSTFHVRQYAIELERMEKGLDELTPELEIELCLGAIEDCANNLKILLKK